MQRPCWEQPRVRCAACLRCLPVLPACLLSVPGRVGPRRKVLLPSRRAVLVSACLGRQQISAVRMLLLLLAGHGLATCPLLCENPWFQPPLITSWNVI
jgi:hypothetical protein